MKNRKILKNIMILGAILVLFGVCIQGSFATEDLSHIEDLPGNKDVELKMSNHEDTRYMNDDREYSFFYGSGGGTNAYRMRSDNSSGDPQIVETTNQSGTIYIADTGGHGFSHTVLLMVAINGTVPENFKITLTAHGYHWDAIPPTYAPTLATISYVVGVNETYSFNDFMYNSTYKPAFLSNYPIFGGQNVSDLSNMFYLMFVDLDVGTMGYNAWGVPNNLIDFGHAKVDYVIENLPKNSCIAFNIYTYRQVSNSGSYQAAWTNPTAGTLSSQTYWVVYNNVVNIDNTMSNTHIQDLIDAADDNDVIKFLNGTYNNLQLNIKSPLKIIADGLVNFIGNGVGTAFNISSNDVTISGFNIENYQNGIYGEGNNLKIENNNIKNTQTGIRLEGNNNVIYNNNVKNSTQVGIHSNNGINNIVENNEVSDSAIGINVGGQSKNTNIKDNKLINNHDHGIRTTPNTENIIIENNEVENSSQGISVLGSNSIIKNNNVSRTKDTAVYVQGNGGVVENNILRNNENIGIGINANNVEVTGNNIRGAKIGIKVQGDRNRISRNTINATEDIFIDSKLATNTVVSGNINVNQNNNNKNTTTPPQNVATTITMSNHAGIHGKIVQLRAVLRDAQGKAISGRIVTFLVNNKVVGTGVTNTAGLATFNYRVTSTGTLSLRATFATTGNHLSSARDTRLTVPKLSVLTVKNTRTIKRSTVTVKSVLANRGPDRTDKLRITYKLDKRFFYTAINVTTGRLSFNRKTRILTWTIDSLRVHKSKSAVLTWKMKANKGRYSIATPKVSKVNTMQVTRNNAFKAFRVR